ncbi:MAG: hypothetical protein OXC96_04755 [Cyanobacteria bacterium MAG CAR1_bin_15]|nr:hypothetical protein [Cyanobacteria bacterium MAG CAR1_bin_15]
MALEALSCYDTSAGQRLVALDALVDRDYGNIYEQLTKGRQLQSMSREAVVLTKAAQGHKPCSSGRCSMVNRSCQSLPGTVGRHAVNVSRRIRRSAAGAGQS